MKKASILNMPEDLLDEDQTHRRLRSKTGKAEYVINKQDRLREPVVDELVTEVANILGINFQELSHWTKEAVVPEEVLKSILRVAKRYQLNPVLGQVDWEQNPEGGYEVYIPIDGWIAMIHREPSFKGLTFDQCSETEQGVPHWMECSIYRSGLIQPITVREYYSELKTDHPIWRQMPRRMLRHKTLQQCARLAFGISIQELQDFEHAIKKFSQIRKKLKGSKTDQKFLLKRKLTSLYPKSTTMHKS